MAFPNISDILATTIENRSRKTADQVTKNNGLLSRLKTRGNIRTFSGGTDFMNAATATPNGKLVVGGGQDSVLWLWNGENGQAIKNIPPPTPESNKQATK